MQTPRLQRPPPRLGGRDRRDQVAAVAAGRRRRHLHRRRRGNPWSCPFCHRPPLLARPSAGETKRNTRGDASRRRRGAGAGRSRVPGKAVGHRVVLVAPFQQSARGRFADNQPRFSYYHRRCFSVTGARWYGLGRLLPARCWSGCYRKQARTNPTASCTLYNAPFTHIRAVSTVSPVYRLFSI